MTKYFKVAEHLFSLEMPDSCSLWSRLGQYDPFEVEGDAGGVLFHLTLVLGGQFEPEPSRKIMYDAPTEPGETVIKLFKTDEGWSFDMTPDRDIPFSSHLRASGDFSRGFLFLDNRRVSDAVFGINNSMMLLYAFRSAPLDTLELHASMVSNSGKAFLFLAKSGTGKSTHSSLWLKHIPGSELMNDDNPVVRAWPDGRVIAYGTPWSGKTPCYRNIEAPVGAFVRIQRAPENKISPLNLLKSYALLYSSCSGFKADRGIADGLHSTLERAVTTVPCYVLECRPDEEAARVCAAEVLK
ncbi:MAG: hypothetical protein IJU68_02865 [Bacteroidales bacterium]|nr:hypothetical protein [Bacteroidales bacterium]